MMQGLSRPMRRARRRTRSRRQAWINIVPMVDVLTVLVFFLLINSTGVSILELRLPSASASLQQPPPHQLTVTLEPKALLVADGGTALGQINLLADGHYDIDALGKLIIDLKRRMPEEDKITLLVEPATSYRALVAVMDTVKAQPSPDSPATLSLFPAISLGDAPGAEAKP
ncbi:MAG: biopolymer transporter ExbD [Nevskiaceae bacterium]|nr:MAG: biopolymer transporter ExbD [Nevskiaceae bacterium]TBR74130.1 MAG: biopolymer transporter ExbD [Nevskiaceae bacterium]